MSDIRSFVDTIFDELISIRRDIHAHPETGMHETRTAALIRSELEKMGVDEIRQPLPTAVVALIHGKKGPGKCVALRADIDALPVHEETGLPFASETEGVMHACGHDLHTTMLLGAAKTLCHMRDQFAGTVKLIFEPSEDLMPGGARALVAAGVMENPHVDAIFGQHVCPSENDSVGRMQLYKGYFTSAVDLFHISVHGKSGHGAAPHTARDAIACAGYLITVLQTVVSRRIDPMDTAVLTVGTMSGGDAVNITAGEARMVAVLRSFSDAGRDTAIQEVRRICKGIGIAFDCDIEVNLEEGYALQYNDPAMIDLVNKAVTAAGGKAEFIDKPFSGSEDFSFFGKLTGTPSAFMMVDAGRGENAVSLHNGKIVFDGVVESAKTALANGIPVALGNDVGCPYITQYDFWRELCYFHKYCGVSNQFALYTATLRNAQLAGVGDVTGSIEPGKSADFIVTKHNPLEDLRALQHLELVVCRGHVIKKPNPKRNKTVDALLDPYLE
mgnify:CR=1 FL=1